MDYQLLLEIVGGGAVGILTIQGVTKLVQAIKAPSKKDAIVGDPELRSAIIKMTERVTELITVAKHNEVNQGALMASVNRMSEILIKIDLSNDEVIRLARLMQEKVMRGEA
jgi:siroheme synthase